MSAQEPKEEPTKSPEPKKETPQSSKGFAKEKIDGLFGYAKNNTRDTIAFILLVIGLLMTIFQPFFGTLLIGFIFGIYYSNEIVHILRNFNDWIEEKGTVRSIVLGVTLAAILIVVPGLIIGALLTLLLRYIIDVST